MTTTHLSGIICFASSRPIYATRQYGHELRFLCCRYTDAFVT